MRVNLVSLLFVFSLAVYHSVAKKQPITNNRDSSSLPNLLLLISDQWRADWADDYFISDLPIKTPVFSELAARGTRFLRTVVASPLCAPSRACLATGREYSQTGVVDNHEDLDPSLPNIYQLLRDEADYEVFTVGKDDLTKMSSVGLNGSYHAKDLGFSRWQRTNGKAPGVHSWPQPNDPYTAWLDRFPMKDDNNNNNNNETLFDYNCECQFDVSPYDSNLTATPLCCDHSDRWHYHLCSLPLQFDDYFYMDDYIVRSASMLIDQTDNIRKPWMMQVNTAGPHWPTVITQAMNESVQGRSPMPTPVNSTVDSYNFTIIAREYLAEIEHIDGLFGDVLTTAKQKSVNAQRDLIVCMTSDHGDLLADFDQFDKKQPWFGSVNVPLVCASYASVNNDDRKDQRRKRKMVGVESKTMKDIRSGVMFDNITVTNMDLSATMLDYAGLNVSKISMETGMTAHSLRMLLTNDDESSAVQDYRDYVQSGFKEWRMVIEQSTQLKLVCCNLTCPGDRSELRADPNTGWVSALFNTSEDLYDLNDLSEQMPDDVTRLSNQLLDGYCQGTIHP